MDSISHQHDYDAIIIGAGLGGLLSAAQLLQRGKRVVVLERLPHCGGRFTAKTFQGVQVSTGAVHMIPFGSSGVLARMLRRLHIPHHFFDADVFASFHVHGKQVRSKGLLGTLKVFGPRQFFWFTRVGYLMFIRRLPAHERDLPFDQWLARHIDVKRNRELTAFFERISRFALSLELHQVSAAEVVRTTKNMLRFGAPGFVEGGCGALTAELQRHITDQGAEVRLQCEVEQILHSDGRVAGVRARNKTKGEEYLLHAPLIISDLGPRATSALLNNVQIRQADVLHHHTAVEYPIHEAIGLKVHVLSDVSLIPHKGIMYCLDTQRIAGIVQPTNCDPRLAPPGKHLLISHQVMQSNNVEEEKKLALADLRMLFGETFEKHCRILTMSAYRGEWPVNRSAQGEDLPPETSIQGLYLVGDAVKPSGYLMVEGVAQSVNSFLDLFDAIEQGKGLIRPANPSGRDLSRPYINVTRGKDEPVNGLVDSGRDKSRPYSNVTPPPSRINALRWLWEAPGNSKEKHGHTLP
ncbi:MAG TPA: NAD(P)/FAD-dependent oxidoreductase [Ktedonobacteraceae bacterium]|nr:NAD(P)/FAD-dependent oxidoreductase [Ktedonobacteraceae bacterium]